MFFINKNKNKILKKKIKNLVGTREIWIFFKIKSIVILYVFYFYLFVRKKTINGNNNNNNNNTYKQVERINKSKNDLSNKLKNKNKDNVVK